MHKNTSKIALFLLLSIGLLTGCSKKNGAVPPVDDPAAYKTLIIGSWKVYNESQFQETGQDGRKVIGSDENAITLEFTADGKSKNSSNSVGLSYSISDHQLKIGPSVFTIITLNKHHLLLERLIGRDIENAGKIGNLYQISKGTK